MDFGLDSARASSSSPATTTSQTGPRSDGYACRAAGPAPVRPSGDQLSRRHHQLLVMRPDRKLIGRDAESRYPLLIRALERRSRFLRAQTAHARQSRGCDQRWDGQPVFAKNALKSTMVGGGSGIRTRDTVSGIHTFQACAFNHSATPPAADRAPERARGLPGAARAARCRAVSRVCRRAQGTPGRAARKPPGRRSQPSASRWKRTCSTFARSKACITCWYERSMASSPSPGLSSGFSTNISSERPVTA
jgi:hypothetical protein